MKRKSLILLLSLLFVICLNGCTVHAHGYYEDDTKIIKHMDSHSTIGSVFNNTADKFSLSASQLDGCIKLKSLSIEENAILDVSLSLESGRMKLVAIPADTKNVIVVVEVTQEEPTHTQPVESTLAAGEYRFVLVAELAQTVQFHFDY